MKKRKVAAVICEYNPFHNGHAALLKHLRQEVGEECAIVAIMSGNYTQRGEPAIFPKQIRALCAIRGGADLVLELPFPYSCSGAERFASAGISIANSLGIVDLLFFGSECGELAPLLHLAEQLESPRFAEAFQAAGEHSNIGCAQKTEVIYREVYGDSSELLPLLRKPNNLLGIEYIRALLRSNSAIQPLTFMRQGMHHGECTPASEEGITSASAARQALLCESEREGMLNRLPACTKSIIQAAIESGNMLSAQDSLLPYYLFYYRICNRDDLVLCDGMRGGLADRILRAANEAATPDAFFAALRSKKHTDSYLRRALLYGMLGVRREQLNAPPAYTQILAMNERGREILASARKKATIPILNRPSAINRFPEDVKISLRADSIYSALLVCPSRPCDQIRYQPHCENT